MGCGTGKPAAVVLPASQQSVHAQQPSYLSPCIPNRCFAPGSPAPSHTTQNAAGSSTLHGASVSHHGAGSASGIDASAGQSIGQATVLPVQERIVQGPGSPGALPASECCVTLRFLRDFTSKLPRPNMTTREVVQEVIIPATATLRCRYVELPSTNPELRPHPQHFVCHSWDAPFQQLVSYITSYLQLDEPGEADPALWDTVLWVDVFAVNQHPGVSRDADLSELQEVLRCSLTTLICLDAGAQALTRTWCLYEIWQSYIIAGDKRIVLLPYELDPSCIAPMIAQVNFETSQTSVEEDRAKLLEDVQKQSTLEAVSGVVRDALATAWGKVDKGRLVMYANGMLATAGLMAVGPTPLPPGPPANAYIPCASCNQLLPVAPLANRVACMCGHITQVAQQDPGSSSTSCSSSQSSSPDSSMHVGAGYRFNPTFGRPPALPTYPSYPLPPVAPPAYGNLATGFGGSAPPFPASRYGSPLGPPPITVGAGSV